MFLALRNIKSSRRAHKLRKKIKHNFSVHSVKEKKGPRKYCYGHRDPLMTSKGRNKRKKKPGGVLPYKGLMGTCGKPGYVFRDFCLKQGIEFIIFCLNQGINLSIFVLNGISFLGR